MNEKIQPVFVIIKEQSKSKKILNALRVVRSVMFTATAFTYCQAIIKSVNEYTKGKNQKETLKTEASKQD